MPASRPRPAPPAADARRSWPESLLLLTTLTPLATLPGAFTGPVVARAVFFRSLVLVAAFLWLLRLAGRERTWKASDPVLWSLVAFLVFNALSAVAGPAPLRSLFGDMERMGGLLSWLHLGLYYLVLRCALSEQGWSRLLAAAAAVATVVSALAVAEAVGRAPELAFGSDAVVPAFRATGPVGNPGFLAAYLLLAVGLTLVLILRPVPRALRLLLLAALPLHLAALLLTRGRTVVLAVPLGLAVGFAAALLVSRGRAARRVLATGGAALAVALLAAIVVPGEAWRRLPGADRVVAISWSEDLRIDFWKAALASAAEHPLLGTGLENAWLAQSAHLDPGVYRLEASWTTYVDRFHNAFLDALAAAGAPGAAAYLLVWASLLYLLVRGARRGRIPRGEAVVLCGTFAAYVTHLAFWFEDWSSITLALLLAAYVGHRTAGAPLVSPGPPGSGSPRAGLVPVVAGITVALLLHEHGVEVLRAAHLASEARERPTAEGRFRLTEQALDVNALGDRPIVFSLVDDLGAVALQVRDDRPSPALVRRIDELVARALVELDAELAADPRNDLLLGRQAEAWRAAFLLHGERRFLDRALRSLERAIALAPRRVPYRELRAELYLAAGMLEEAERALREAREIFPASGSGSSLSAAVELSKGDPRAAAAWLRRAFGQVHAPDDPRLVGEVATALDREGRAAEAAGLVRDYLDAFAGWSDRTVEEGEKEPLRPGARELAARLPVLLLRAGAAGPAVAAARRLAARASGADAGVDRFVGEVERGEVGRWLERAAVPLPPPPGSGARVP